MLNCLGTYNPLLEESIFTYYYTTYQEDQDEVKSECMKIFYVGCTKLKKNEFYDYPLPTLGVNYLINNCTQL